MRKDDILIAGIGNIFYGDDAFGSEVARRLMSRSTPAGVHVVDFGIRGLDLAYALLDGCRVAILIDAAPRGEPPGTLYVLELDEPSGGPEVVEAHSLDPQNVLRLAASLGARIERVLLVGCEPAPFDPDEMQSALSPAVSAAVEPALELIETLIRKLLENDGEPHEPRTRISQEDPSGRV